MGNPFEAAAALTPVAPRSPAVDRSDRMALIGAGPVGLGLAKAMLEHSIPYEQLEADNDLGGNWYHGVYSSAHIISSKKTTEYADYPMPPDYPDFPSARQMLDYLRDYARAFNLRPHIQFNTKVVLALPRVDGSWEVTLAGAEKRVYKGLVVCNGHHWDKFIPGYPGVFTGKSFHSKDYKCPQQLAGQRVLVIGGGNSACDIASEAARVGKSASISLRRGYWFLPRTIFGVALPDLRILLSCPVRLQRLCLRLLLRVVVGKYESYGLPKPDHRIFDHHPTINSELLYYLKQGRLRARPDVARFAGSQAHFTDGSSEDLDVVVYATGYNVSFPFLPAGIAPVRGKTIQLYGGAVSAEYKNLYVVGTMQPRYGFGPLVTPGADLICRMMKLQDRMELPIGLVMKESGTPLPRTHLVDPIASLRRMRRARLTLPLLLRKERRLREKLPLERRTFVAPAVADPPSGSDLEVY